MTFATLHETLVTARTAAMGLKNEAVGQNPLREAYSDIAWACVRAIHCKTEIAAALLKEGDEGALVFGVSDEVFISADGEELRLP